MQLPSEFVACPFCFEQLSRSLGFAVSCSYFAYRIRPVWEKQVNSGTDIVPVGRQRRNQGCKYVHQPGSLLVTPTLCASPFRCLSPTHPSPVTLLVLSVTGYIFSLQFAGLVGSSICLLHALFRPPVARAVRNARSGDPELHGGDGDLEGGGAVGRGRAGPVNANMRLRTRPALGGPMGMASPPGAGGSMAGFHQTPPIGDPTGSRLHSHAT